MRWDELLIGTILFLCAILGLILVGINIYRLTH